MRPVFQLLADKYSGADYAPEAVAERCGLTVETIKRLAAELAHVAFEEEIVVDQPWTDWKGERHEKDDRAACVVPRDAGDFGALERLSDLPGAASFADPFGLGRSARWVSLQAALPLSLPQRIQTAYRSHAPNTPLDGPHLGVTHGPEDLQIDADGTPRRIDKAFSWENPISAHGMMHMVISNAHAGDPYKIDTLFMYMANMSWNSSMNTRGVMEMLSDKDENGDYVNPAYHLFGRVFIRDGGLCRSCATRYDLSGTHDCISLLDRPICEADAAADAIRWPVLEPDRDVKGFQTALIELGVKLGLPGFVKDGQAVYKDYADYMVNHERRPGVGPLAGWRGDGTGKGRGAPNPEQLDRYIENGGFWMEHVPDEGAYYKPWNKAISGLGGGNRALRCAPALPVQYLPRKPRQVPVGRIRPWRQTTPRSSTPAHTGLPRSAAALVPAL